MPNTRKNRVKLLDIAQASGVSLTAVSLALSDKPGISQETRARVIEIARSLGYRFRSPISSAPIKTIRTIGLLVKADSNNEAHANHFYSHVIAGIESTCRQMGINLMFANLPVDSENVPVEVPALLEKGDVDGIMLAGVFVDEALIRALEARRCPVVLIDSYAEKRVFNSVLSDNFEGAYQAVEYLIRKGHRQVAFIGGHERAYPSFNDRRAGYRKALRDYEIPCSYFANCSHNRAEITAVTIELLQKNPQITGIIGVNDETAISVMYALIENGIRVPQDISVIGFDDIYLAESVVPSLSTMHVNKQSMGRMAVQMLVNQVYQAEGGYITSVFRPSLVERNSVMTVLHKENAEQRRP